MNITDYNNKQIRNGSILINKIVDQYQEDQKINKI